MSKWSRKFSVRKWIRRRSNRDLTTAPRKRGRLRAALTLAPLREQLRKGLRAFFRFQEPVWAKTAAALRYSPKKKLRWYDYLNPVYQVAWFFGFSYRWIISRPYLSIGPALFSLAVILAIVGIVLNQRFARSDARGDQYRDLLATATAVKDYDTAKICLTRLVNLYPKRDTYAFQLALIEDELGNAELALQKMGQLAGRKNPEASLFLVLRHFDPTKAADWSEQENAEFQSLVAIAMTSRTNAVQARIQLARYSLVKGAIHEAAQHYAIASETDPSLQLMTALLYKQLNDEPNVLRYSELALKRLSARLSADPSDKTARLEKAQILMLQQKEYEAASLLGEGYKLTNDMDFATAGAESLVALASRIRRQEGNTKASLAKQMTRLQQAIQLSPNSEVVLEFLLETAINVADNNDQELTKLRELMLAGVSSEYIHFVEGTVALLKDDIEKANFHLDLAMQGQRQSAGENQLPGLLNNLAVALSKRDKPDLERALAFAESAVARVPDHPYIRETRGQILVALKRYVEAIPDLEFALRAPELAGPVHQSLSVAYAAMGDQQAATEHSRLASASGKSPPKPGPIIPNTP